MEINPETKIEFIRFQQNEMTESKVYSRLAKIEKDPENKKILAQIAQEEISHYQILKKYTGKDVRPHHFRIFKYYWLAYNRQNDWYKFSKRSVHKKSLIIV